VSVFRAQEDRRAALARIADNTARHAVVTGRFTTRGSLGEMVNPTPFDFGIAFTAAPAVSYGYHVDGDTLMASHYPRCWGGTCEWRRDPSTGLYTGAQAFVVIETISVAYLAFDSPPDYEIEHHFTFNGIAVKFAPGAFDDGVDPRGYPSNMDLLGDDTF
jgi:hypothetical protein